MKNLLLGLLTSMVICGSLSGQTDEINKNNSWLKFGVNLGAPTGSISNISNFVGGLELKAQFMETDHVGIGLGVGYNHFFGKGVLGDFGTVPLGGFIRLYPNREGFFFGLDAGHSLVTNAGNLNGGFFVKPQLGYHNYDWNLFAFYNEVFRKPINGGNIPHVGLGATYNIHFK